MNFRFLFEMDRALEHAMPDMGELNYWARRIGFQKLVDYKLIEV